MSNPNKHVIKSSTKSLIILSKFSRVLALAPSYTKEKNSFIIYNAQKYWNIFILTVYLTAFLYLVQNHISTNINIWKSWLIMDPVATIAIIYINIFAIANGSFLNRKAHVEIWNVLLETDRNLRKFEVRILTRTRNLFLKLFLIHFGALYTFSWIFHNYMTQPDPKYSGASYFFLENAQRYHVGGTVVLMQHLKVSIKTQFENINEILRMYTEDTPTALDVAKLRDIYIVLLAQIGNFNKVFGRIILVFFLSAVLSYLLSFCSITVNGLDLIEMGYYFSMSLIHLSVILWMISIIAITCGDTTRVAKETGPLCYALCAELRRQHNTALYDELLTFARVASSSDPVVSAAGFFNVDRAMLSHIFTIIISYIIVLLQLFR